MNRHKKRHLWASGMAGILATLLLFSCDNDNFPVDNEPGKASDGIYFGVSSTGAGQTRGTADTDNDDGITVDRFVLRGDNTTDTLCVSTIVSDGIHASTLVGENGATRATPVTKDDFYTAFKVLAYWKTGETLHPEFYMNETVTDKGGNVWGTTGNTYYWPGNVHTLQFYAYAPADAPGITTEPTSPQQDKKLAYTVPADVANQKDVVVATTAEIQGDSKTVVPLTFNHINTAVRFVVGSDMQPGTIQSITLKGVRNSGSYDMNTDAWALNTSSVANFSQTLNKTTTAGMANGTEITTAEGTFMMLPQTLPAGATIEVVFHDNLSNQDRTLTASVAGQEWPMGKTVTYKLSISPEYELEFISEPVLQDAHYIIYPIKIKAGEIAGGWTMTSEQSWVTLRVNLTDLQAQGYWIESDKGTASISGSAGEDITVYAFLTENIGNDIRNAVLKLRPTNMLNATPVTFTISQLCPAWNGTGIGTLGCERIEDGDYPWGFKWPANYKVIYNMGTGLGTAIYGLIIRIFGLQYSSVSGSGLWDDLKITIDYSQVSASNVALSTSNGYQNTLDLYNYQGISNAADLENRLANMGGVRSVEPAGATIQNPTEFAARACAMKNKYGKTTETNQGQTVEKPVLNPNDLVWYLPSQTESTQMNDPQYPLSGNYWTSTALDDNANAYKVNGSNTSSEDRATKLHVRAVRKKP
ncbi:fimbrillin family protein [Proteiniphilum sp.]|uniref:fimbrillin family protein n=1 Tax=Proteiniphilum sp. TaxID=1926877 RepID=UPI00332D0BA8